MPRTVRIDYEKSRNKQQLSYSQMQIDDHKHVFDHVNAYSYTCGRCDGTGYIHQYKHVDSGVCFLCRGDGLTVRRNFSDNRRISKNHNCTALRTRRWCFVVVLVEGNYYVLDSFTSDDVNRTAYHRRHSEYVLEANKKLPKNRGINLWLGNFAEKKVDAINRMSLKFVQFKSA